jgi:hypothetical protein
VLTGGYAQLWTRRGWTQITGTKAQRSRRAKAQIGSRRERRVREWVAWERSHARVEGNVFSSSTREAYQEVDL